MKKLLYFTFVLLFAFVVFSCPPPPPPPPPEPHTLDKRLVGGKWYEPKNYVNNYNTPDYENGYFEFFDDPDMKMIATVRLQNAGILTNGDFEEPVYSKDGVIWYTKIGWSDYYKIMDYQFHKTFPYPNNVIPLPYDARVFFNTKADEGDLITYRIYTSDGKPYNNGLAYDIFLIRY